MNNYKKPGDTMTFTAPGGGVVSGTAYLIGALLVVAASTVAATLPFEGVVEGVFTLPKTTGTAWTEGEALYWDNSTKKLTTVSTGNTAVGVAAAVAASGDATGDVRLEGTRIGANGVQSIVLGTTAPDGISGTLFASTDGTKTGVVPNGSYVGQPLRVVQSAVANTPVGTLTGLFANQAGTAKTTIALGTAVGLIFDGVWDGTAYRQVAAIGGTGSSIS